MDLRDPHPPREPPRSPSLAQGLFVSAANAGKAPRGQQLDLGESSQIRKAKGFAISTLNYSRDPLSLPDASEAERNLAMVI